MAKDDPLAIRKFYEKALQQRAAVEQAAIAVEAIKGPILLASGHDDQMWPSETMADAICARLKVKGFAHRYEHLKYADAGHTLTEYYMMGGTREGNQRARLDLATRMLAFLNELSGTLAKCADAPGR
jgi:dienelactone hydrolase